MSHPQYLPGFKITQKPGRLLWFINKVPTWAFRIGLGKLFGSRFAMVIHRGRKTGKLNTVILEVADGSIESGRIVFVSAWGSNAQWYRNLESGRAPRLEINGKIYLEPRHEFLSPEGTEKAINSYFSRYSGIASFLAKQGFYPYPGPVGSYQGAPTGIVFHLENPL